MRILLWRLHFRFLEQEVIEHKLSSEKEISEAIDRASEEFDISLSEAETVQLAELLQKIEKLDLNLKSIKNQAQALYQKLSEIDTKSFIDKIVEFFRSIINFFKGLFS